MKQVYQNYEQVPWYRRSDFNSLLVLVGALFFPPMLWWVVFNLFTGDVYYNRTGNDGNLKTWSIANKVVAVIFLIVQALFVRIPSVVYTFSLFRIKCKHYDNS